MFKLLKLAFYAIIGYALYELYQGMMQRPAQASDEGMRSFGEGGGRHGQITGPGLGKDDVTSDESGAEIHHRVGRGVVSR